MEENKDQNQISIPKSVTLGGVTYPIGETPELKQLIQAVASVEKSKLHSTFDGLKKQIENLQGVTVVPQGQQPLDTKGIIAELKQELSNSFVSKEDLKSELKEVVQPLLQSTQEAKQKELNIYREQIINKNLATCIPELVTGNSREELDAALQKSIQLRASYPSANAPVPTGAHVTDPTLQQQASQPQFQAQSPTNPVFSGEQPGQPTYQKPSAPAVPPMQQPLDSSHQQASPKSLSMEEFGKKREAMLAELTASYGGVGDSVL